jgi:hypothetical protein
MEDKNFLWESLKLSWDRYARSLVTDRFITDFSRAWTGVPHDESGAVAGGVPPDWWTEAYLRSLKRQRKDGVTMTVPGTSITFTRDEFGNTTIRTPNGIVQVMGAEWNAFMRVAMTIPNGAPYLGPGIANPGGVNPASFNAPIGAVSSSDDRPVIKERQRQNDAALEFAMRNQSEAQLKLGKDQQATRKRRLREELEL